MGVTMLELPGLNQNTGTNNSGFDSPPEAEKTMAGYNIPPVVWMIAFLIGGYLLVRYAMDE